MKRFLLIAVALLMMIVPFSSVNAINLDMDSPHLLAEWMPDTTDVFIGSRIGEDFVEELDAISLSLYEKIPESYGVETYELDETLRMMFAEEGVDYDELAAAFGDYAGIGLEIVDGINDGEQPNIYVVAEVEEQQAAADAFVNALPEGADIPEPLTVDGNIVYVDPDEEAVIIVTPTHMIVTNIIDLELPIEAPLSASADFTGALEMLPADTYNAVGFLSEEFMETLIAESDEGDLEDMGINPTDAGAVAFGATILSGDTFTIDIAIQTASPVPTSTVNVDFLNAMPAGTDAFITATDLTNVYRAAAETARTAAEANDEPDPTTQIAGVLNMMVGLDLEEDILSWTTGSYGVFFGTDYNALLNDVIENGTVTDIKLDFGIVIEATDPALAQNFAGSLGEFMAQAGEEQEDVTITTADGLTSIVVEADMGMGADPLELEFVMTSTDDFFFLGTRQSYDAVVNGDTLAGEEDFARSTQYFLTDASSVSYVNADGWLGMTIVPLAALGPAIGNVFDNIVAELEGETDEDASSSPLAMLGEDPALIGELLDVFDSMFAHATITTSIDGDSVVRVRATMTLNP